MTRNIVDELLSSVQMLAGKKCWSFKAGKGTGSHVNLDFGKKLLRNQAIQNRHLSKEQRLFAGEMGIFIQCSWRLDAADTVICGSKNNNSNNGLMRKGLRRILDRKVLSVELFRPAYDLNIIFNNKVTLKIFCDETERIEPFNNYSIFTPKIIYTVGNKSKLTIEKRKSVQTE